MGDQWLGAADLGFDPLNLAVGTGTFDTAASAVPQTTYYNYRESEVKHGRFAMTAFLAIFFEEADRGAVARQLGFPDAVDNLDGTLGLDEVQLPVLLVGLGIQALAEYNLQKSENDGNILSVEYKRDRCPGDLGFDPLNALKGSGSNKKYLHSAEVAQLRGWLHAVRQGSSDASPLSCEGADTEARRSLFSMCAGAATSGVKARQ